MAEHTFWETIEATGGAVLDKVKEIVAAGNVRRVRVRQKHRILAEFPLTVGVVGAVFAPMLAAVGAIAALGHRLHDRGRAHRRGSGDVPPNGIGRVIGRAPLRHSLWRHRSTAPTR